MLSTSESSHLPVVAYNMNPSDLDHPPGMVPWSRSLLTSQPFAPCFDWVFYLLLADQAGSLDEMDHDSSARSHFMYPTTRCLRKRTGGRLLMVALLAYIMDTKAFPESTL